MPTITLSLKLHKDEERIFVEFIYNKKINDVVRQVLGVKWSQTHKKWQQHKYHDTLHSCQQGADWQDKKSAG
jgi:hypothetical protein